MEKCLFIPNYFRKYSSTTLINNRYFGIFANMCGITGIFAFNQLGRLHMINLSKATNAMEHRGPDLGKTTTFEHVGLGHRRLSIIDPSPLGAQPMKDPSERFTIVYNGEIYNFLEIRKSLEQRGHQFSSNCDTEVLLAAYIAYGSQCVPLLNGFFAFAIYDQLKDELFLARDRYGIKPLLYYLDEDKFIFASELRAVLRYGIDKEIDANALYIYLQLNYLPQPQSMVKGVTSLKPGHWLKVSNKGVEENTYYAASISKSTSISFEDACDELRRLIEDSVLQRLVSDVPLGTFLSGGVDSTVISGIASKHTDQLKTFSIGYRDDPFFDETNYAEAAAKKFGTDHHVFKLSYYEMNEALPKVLDALDQPFADSSAIPVYLLSKYTRELVTVALSGDGADELFSGYNKHKAHLIASKNGFNSNAIGFLGAFSRLFPKSRNSFVANKFRQIDRFAKAQKLSPDERYWLWASISEAQEVVNALDPSTHEQLDFEQFDITKSAILENINTDSLNEVLLTDQQLVLEGDMLRKVDLMSMANSLEVRVPFLDHRIVDFVNSLPVEYKINRHMKKRILQVAFKDLLPKQIYKRPKHGFEVPLLNWFKTSRFSWIFDEVLAPDKVEADGILDPDYILSLKKQLLSKNPGDSHAKLYALIAFQWWFDKEMR